MSQEQDQPDASGGSTGPDGQATAGATSSSFDVVTIRSYLVRAAVVLLGLLAAMATLRFYSSASRAIEVWLSRRYVPLFQAGFNLVILLAAIAAILFITRRYRDT